MILGHGNVAMDIARVLLSPIDKLRVRLHIVFILVESLSSLILHHSLIYAYLIFHQQLPASVNTNFLRSPRLNFILKPHSSQISLHNTLCIDWNKLKHNIKTASSKACFKKYIKQS